MGKQDQEAGWAADGSRREASPGQPWRSSRSSEEMLGLGGGQAMALEVRRPGAAPGAGVREGRFRGSQRSGPGVFTLAGDCGVSGLSWAPASNGPAPCLSTSALCVCLVQQEGWCCGQWTHVGVITVHHAPTIRSCAGWPRCLSGEKRQQLVSLTTYFVPVPLQVLSIILRVTCLHTRKLRQEPRRS